MSETFNDNPTKIREGEELDNAELSNYLSNFLDVSKSDFEILQFPSGFSNLTYLIKSNQKEYILRKPPIGAKVKSGHDLYHFIIVMTSIL
jgi:aminoglycoside phosphotransferase (APT) family kinase protein